MKPGTLVKDVIKPYNTGVVLDIFLHNQVSCQAVMPVRTKFLALVVLWYYGIETVFSDEIVLIEK
jgi:hypothetical protein